MILPLKTALNDENPGWPAANVALMAVTGILLVTSIITDLIPNGAPGLAGGLICLIGFGNALNRRLGHARYLSLCGVVALFCLGLGHGSPQLVASAVGVGVAGATLTLMPFASVTLMVWIHPLLTAGIVILFGSNLGSLMFLGFVSILYWIYVLRSWNWYSARELVGELLFLKKLHVSSLCVVLALVAFCGFQLTQDSNTVGWAPLLGTAIGIVVAALANLVGEAGQSESPTVLEWLEWVEPDQAMPRPASKATTITTVRPKLVVRAGFAD